MLPRTKRASSTLVRRAKQRVTRAHNRYKRWHTRKNDRAFQSALGVLVALVGLGTAMAFVQKPKASTVTKSAEKTHVKPRARSSLESEALGDPQKPKAIKVTKSTAKTNVGPRARSSSKSEELGRPQKLLITRMTERLPLALEEMQHCNKTSHWAWWAFPTEKPGDKEEPKGPTYVTKGTAVKVIRQAPAVWQQTLERVCACEQKSSKRVLPQEDHGRVQYFVRFWSDVQTPPWLTSVIQQLKKKYD